MSAIPATTEDGHAIRGNRGGRDVMRLICISVPVPDVPGALGLLTTAVSAAGANILGIDVEQCDGATVMDRLTLALPHGLSDEQLVRIVQRAGPFDVRVTPAGPTDLGDQVVSALNQASAVVDATGWRSAAEQSLRMLGGAEEAWLLPAAADLRGIVGRASASRTPMLERTREFATAGGGPAWLLALPDESGRRSRVVAVLAKDIEPFTATQVARVRAMFRLLVALRERRSADSPADSWPVLRTGDWPVTYTLDDGTPVQLRGGADIDRVALLRLHARCSRATLRHRFHSPRPVLRSSTLDVLLPAAGTTAFSMVAFHDGEAVATASCYRVGEEGDVGLLVEDRFQGRGLGALLLEHLTALARQDGLTRLRGDVLAGNRRMTALAARVDMTLTSKGSGTLEATLPTERSARTTQG